MCDGFQQLHTLLRNVDVVDGVLWEIPEGFCLHAQ